MRGLVMVLPLVAITAPIPAWAQQPQVHDGVHVRAALGAGYGADRAARESDSGETEGTVGGMALAGELSAGYAIVPGGIVGAGFYFNHVPTPKAQDIDWRQGLGVVHIDEIEFDRGGYWMLGPMFDYYPVPSGGLHASLAIGWGVFGLGDGELDNGLAVDTSQKGGGISGALGIGYDLWVADVVSVGALARFMIARGTAEDEESADWTHTVYAPALLLSAAFD
jgi:hypothetical protein